MTVTNKLRASSSQFFGFFCGPQDEFFYSSHSSAFKLLIARIYQVSSRVKSVSCSVMSNCLQPHGLLTLCPCSSPGKSTEVGKPFSSPGDLPYSGIKPGSPALQADFLPSKLPGLTHLQLLTFIDCTENALS